MPPCSLSLEGLAEKWALEVELVTRLHRTGKILEAKGPEEMKTCNRDVGHNHRAMRPVMELIAEDANWELFPLKEADKQPLASKPSIQIMSTMF